MPTSAACRREEETKAKSEKTARVEEGKKGKVLVCEGEKKKNVWVARQKRGGSGESSTSGLSWRRVQREGERPWVSLGVKVQ